MIVDDHAGFRSFARALLAAEGFVVIGEASDGCSALDAVALMDPDLVLLDVALPDIDGFTVCRRLAERDAERPVVILTSSRDVSSFRVRLAASEARGFIAKDDLSAATIGELIG